MAIMLYPKVLRSRKRIKNYVEILSKMMAKWLSLSFRIEKRILDFEQYLCILSLKHNTKSQGRVQTQKVV